MGQKTPQYDKHNAKKPTQLCQKKQQHMYKLLKSVQESFTGNISGLFYTDHKVGEKLFKFQTFPEPQTYF